MKLNKKYLGLGLLLLVGGISATMQFSTGGKTQVEDMLEETPAEYLVTYDMSREEIEETEIVEEEAQEVWVDRVDKGLILDEVLVGGHVEYYDQEAEANGPYIKAWIYPQFKDKMAEGQAVRIYTYDGDQSVILNGRLDYMADVEIDEHYEGKISYTNEKKLHIGMIPEMYAVAGQKEDVIRVPLNAVVSKEDGDYVYKIEGFVVREEKIQLGMKSILQAELVEGNLEEGDLLVTYGNAYLKDYDSVLVTEYDFRPSFY